MMMPSTEAQMLIRQNKDLRQEICEMVFHFMNGEVDMSLLRALGTKELCALAKKHTKAANNPEKGESSSSLFVFSRVVAPIEREDRKDSVEINCQGLYDFYYNTLPPIIDAFVKDANKNLKVSVNEDGGPSSDLNQRMDDMRNFIAVLRAQRGASGVGYKSNYKGNPSMIGSHKEAYLTLDCSHCGSPFILTAADADNAIRVLSSTITSDPDEDASAPNTTNNP
ncbi:unnamed protein product [Microthlaspi erraticum]|uniref:Uncharacterized protein n=1 Tax=Microthlaspi erraticum TaxID=1685480 RepID=A0A6D2HEF6_9BRAS|nr:unnamed protein product [Microthlaspi erraticum]